MPKRIHQGMGNAKVDGRLGVPFGRTRYLGFVTGGLLRMLVRWCVPSLGRPLFRDYQSDTSSQLALCLSCTPLGLA
jgi:hypothetical protein